MYENVQKWSSQEVKKKLKKKKNEKFDSRMELK